MKVPLNKKENLKIKFLILFKKAIILIAKLIFNNRINMKYN